MHTEEEIKKAGENAIGFLPKEKLVDERITVRAELLDKNNNVRRIYNIFFAKEYTFNGYKWRYLKYEPHIVSL